MYHAACAYPSRNPIWIFECDCGTRVMRPKHSVMKSPRASCGCRFREPRSPRDHTGERFGKLTAEGIAAQRISDRQYIWRFSCDCGGSALRTIASVRGAKTNTCGCGRSAKSLDRLRGSHRVDISGLRFGRLYARRPFEIRNGRPWWVFAWKLRSNGVNSCDKCRRSGFRIADHPELIRASRRSYRQVYDHNVAVHHAARRAGAPKTGP